MKYFDNKDKNVNEFAKLICKLNAPTLLGLTRLLKVNMFYDDIKDDKVLCDEPWSTQRNPEDIARCRQGEIIWDFNQIYKEPKDLALRRV